MTLFFANFISVILLVALIKNYNKISIAIPLLGGLLFSVSGLIAPILWEWSRKYTGLGLLSFMSISDSQTQTLREIFNWGAIGCAFSAGALALILGTSKKSLQSAAFKDFNYQTLVNDRLGAQSVFLGFSTIILFAIGLGKSIFITTKYLESNGNSLALRIVSSLVVAIIPILMLTTRENRYAKINAILLFLIFLILLGRGSRLSTIIVVSVLASNALVKNRSLIGKFISFILIFVTFAAGIRLNNLARSGPTGVFSVPKMIARMLNDFSTNFDLYSLLGEAMASLTSWVPIVIVSIGTIKKDLVFENMNPLIGAGSNPYDYSSDGISILFPYLWTPLSTIGQMYGLGGGILICIISFLLGSLTGASFLRRTGSRGNIALATASMATYIFQFLMFFQYSTRNWFRSFWVVIFLTTLQIIITFLKPIQTTEKKPGLDIT